jgi:hypothetical protein
MLFFKAFFERGELFQSAFIFSLIRDSNEVRSIYSMFSVMVLNSVVGRNATQRGVAFVK